MFSQLHSCVISFSDGYLATVNLMPSRYTASFFVFIPFLTFYFYFCSWQPQRGIGCEWKEKKKRIDTCVFVSIDPSLRGPCGMIKRRRKKPNSWWWGGRWRGFSSLSPVTYLKPRKVRAYSSLAPQLVDSVDGAHYSSPLLSFLVNEQSWLNFLTS